MEDLQTAVTALQIAVGELGNRLAAYPAGTYDVEIAAATQQVILITAAIEAMAPTPLGRALGLTAVE
jgi:hypothetical protein